VKAADELVHVTYRIEGGVPDGMLESSSEFGERAKSIRIKTTTRHGNNNTSTRGIEKEESPVTSRRGGALHPSSLGCLLTLVVFSSYLGGATLLCCGAPRLIAIAAVRSFFTL
jgi:hypothetical protein